jgi:iron complex outermembrane receptor protein
MIVALAVSAPVRAAENPPSVEDLSTLSLEELTELDVQVTSVSKRPEPLSKAPAAIYVITQDDIRRSGVTSLPEALRLAPNLEVAQVSASQYAISARGFNRFEVSNKVQVLIDGRTIYNPLHAGVFWDVPNLMMEDIDRIEVISGPGGTLWGANAVNGVINIITKSAQDTQGGLVSAQLGNVNQTGAVRWGGPAGPNGAYRVYGLGFQRGHTDTAAGTSVGDDYSGTQGGFRSDWSTLGNAFTLEGDVFRAPYHTGGQAFGGDMLGRWTHDLSKSSNVQVQAYFDKTERDQPGVVEALQTADISVQHNFKTGPHTIVWGGGVRSLDEKLVNNANGFVLVPAEQTMYLGNIFGQDTVALTDDLNLTFGTKFEQSSFTGFEYMPEVRLGWSATSTDFVWGAVSRSVRTPSRIERELQFPGVLNPAPDFQSEKLIAYQLGYRGQFSRKASASVSLYYNDYSDIRTTAFGPGGTLPVQFTNDIHGSTYGAEAWGDYSVLPWWRLSPGLNVIKKDFHIAPGVADESNFQGIGNDPEYQVSLRSSMDLRKDVELDVGVRNVDEMDNPVVPSYTSVDARIGWRVTPTVELSLAGFNLLDDHHPETGVAPQNEIRRSVYLGTRWRF